MNLQTPARILLRGRSPRQTAVTRNADLEEQFVTTCL
jgi:hypothetical protein